jgi:peroxiredoxin
MRADIVAGAVFPDYELTDHSGTRRKLSDLQGPDPMILVLSRGGYCPKDRRQAEGLVQLHREMEVGYSRLVTISTDNMLLTNEYRTGAGAHWTFLSDPGRHVQKDLDIAEYTGPRTQSYGPARHTPRTWSRDLQDLQRLLVCWSADH